MSEENTIYFVNKFSPEKEQIEIPFPISPETTLLNLIPELSSKLEIPQARICLATKGGNVLNEKNYQMPIKELIEKFGISFDILDSGGVGMEPGENEEEEDNHEKEKPRYYWHPTILDKLIPEFGEKWIHVNPKTYQWQERMKLEIKKIADYINYLRNEKSKPWFTLKPQRHPPCKLRIWHGYLRVPDEEEDIKFEIRVLIPPEYPKLSPLCFIDEEVMNYCGKLYPKQTFPQNGKTFILICHDHLEKNEDIWKPSLGIAHFFIREIWIWWATQQNLIVREYLRKNCNGISAEM